MSSFPSSPKGDPSADRARCSQSRRWSSERRTSAGAARARRSASGLRLMDGRPRCTCARCLPLTSLWSAPLHDRVLSIDLLPMARSPLVSIAPLPCSGVTLSFSIAAVTSCRLAVVPLPAFPFLRSSPCGCGHLYTVLPRLALRREGRIQFRYGDVAGAAARGAPAEHEARWPSPRRRRPRGLTRFPPPNTPAAFPA